jgi:hypothetical protein
MNVLNEKMTLISINISTFSGYRRATREHIAALGGTLPTSGAITEGSIKVFPCDGTKALQTARRGIFRKLQSRGIKSLGSQNVFSVLTSELPEIEKEIADAEAEYVAERATLEADYEQIFEAHVAANPEADAIIRSLKVDRVTAIAKCRFAKDIFRIAPFVREGESEQECVDGIVRGLGRQLYEEISADMEKLLKNDAFATNQRVGQKSLRPLKSAIQKMAKFSFLDSSVEGAITMVSDILKSLPQEGYIEGQWFVTLERLVEVMSDTDTLLNAASKVKNGVPVCNVLFPPAPALVVEAPVVEEVVQSAAESTEEIPDAPVVVPPVSVAPKAVVMLPPIPVANVQAFNKAADVKVTEKLSQMGIAPPPGLVRAAPVLKPREALKTNSLMF